MLKVVSPQITHKTDVGGVALDLANDDQVRAAYDRDDGKRARKRGPMPRFAAVSVQPMVSLPGGIELIIGAKKDPVFGPVIMVGLGGIAAELFRDRALGLPPLNERLALRMLESLRAWPLVKGYRGRKPIANVDRLVEVLLRFSMLVADFPEISELDANPVLVRDDRVIALDARVVVDRAAVEHPVARPTRIWRFGRIPDDLVEQAVLADGTPVIVRPIKPEDEPLWHELLASCSPESLWAAISFHVQVRNARGGDPFLLRRLRPRIDRRGRSEHRRPAKAAGRRPAGGRCCRAIAPNLRSWSASRGRAKGWATCSPSTA